MTDERNWTATRYTTGRLRWAMPVWDFDHDEVGYTDLLLADGEQQTHWYRGGVDLLDEADRLHGRLVHICWVPATGGIRSIQHWREVSDHPELRG